MLCTQHPKCRVNTNSKIQRRTCFHTDAQQRLAFTAFEYASVSNDSFSYHFDSLPHLRPHRCFGWIGIHCIRIRLHTQQYHLLSFRIIFLQISLCSEKSSKPCPSLQHSSQSCNMMVLFWSRPCPSLQRKRLQDQSSTSLAGAGNILNQECRIRS